MSCYVFKILINRSHYIRHETITCEVLAVHYAARLEGEVGFEDDGMLDDVFGKRVPMMHQKFGWRDVHSLEAREFQFASDREAWDAWRVQAADLS